MKKSLRIGLVSLAVLLSVSTPIDAAPKKKTFWQKHGGKVMAGIAAAAAIGIAVLAGKHANKTKKIVEEAGFTDKDERPSFGDAMAIVGLLGPLPRARAIEALQFISRIRAGRYKNATKILVTGKAGTALAKYWGISQNQLEREMGYSAIGRAARNVERMAEGDVNGIISEVQAFFGSKKGKK